MRQRRKTGSRLLALLAAAGMVLAACGSDDGDSAAADDAPPPEQPERSVDVSPAPQPLETREELKVTVPVKLEGFADLLVADHFGEFEAENLDVSIEVLPGSEAIVLLGSGDTDINYGSANAAFLNSIHAGLDVRWLSGNYRPNPDSKAGLWVRNELLGDDGELSADDVKGMTVAIGQLGFSAPTAPMLIEYLDELGLDASDVESSPLQGAEMLIALENGGVDAGYVLDPMWQELEGGDVATFIHGFPDFSMGGAFAGPSIEKKPEAIEAFLRAIVRTHRAYLSDDYHADDEVVSAIAEAVGVDPEDITRNPSLVWEADPEVSEEAVAMFQEAWIKADILEYDEPRAFADVANVEPLRNVLDAAK